MWAPVSLGISSKTLKDEVKFSLKLTNKNKRPFFIHRFCDEFSAVAAKDESYGQCENYVSDWIAF
jgi:hypothetical protein